MFYLRPPFLGTPLVPSRLGTGTQTCREAEAGRECRGRQPRGVAGSMAAGAKAVLFAGSWLRDLKRFRAGSAHGVARDGTLVQRDATDDPEQDEPGERTPAGGAAGLPNKQPPGTKIQEWCLCPLKYVLVELSNTRGA